MELLQQAKTYRLLIGNDIDETLAIRATRCNAINIK